MSVSFTGINNIKVLKSQKQGFGVFQGADRELKQGDLNLTEVKLRFNLTNDETGKDMEELQTALKNAKRGYSYDAKNPDLVEIHLKHIDADDGVIPVSNSILSLNGQDINVKGREDMGLYTYLAKLTKRICQRPEMSPAQKQYTNMVRSAIHDNAVYYIDHIM